MKFRPVGEELFLGDKNRQKTEMIKVTVAFGTFAEAPN